MRSDMVAGDVSSAGMGDRVGRCHACAASASTRRVGSGGACWEGALGAWLMSRRAGQGGGSFWLTLPLHMSWSPAAAQGEWQIRERFR